MNAPDREADNDLPGQDLYPYSAIDERPHYEWPEGKALAFYVGVNIEHYAFLTGGGMDPHNRGGGATHRNYSWRDYGNRVGIWRLLDVLDEHRVPATVLLNSAVCSRYLPLMSRLTKRGDEILGHGITNSQTLRGLSEDDERSVIVRTTSDIMRATGKRPLGWLGPGATSNGVTPHLLKENGYTHVLDWPCDDQPFWMNTRAGPLLSIPYPMELNDAGAQVLRDHTGREFADMIVDQFEEMIELCSRQPLVFSLALHGYIVGQPHRTRNLKLALSHCLQSKFRKHLWITTAGGIAAHCAAMPEGVIPGSSV